MYIVDSAVSVPPHITGAGLEKPGELKVSMKGFKHYLRTYISTWYVEQSVGVAEAQAVGVGERVQHRT